MGPVHLTVSDLADSLEFWTRSIGLRVRARDAGVVALGAGDGDLVVLVEEPGAQPAARHTGLFHVALLVPERADLARFLAHVIRTRVPLTGASDHTVSEALYLRDPDLHGIEVYADRPRAGWDGRVEELMGTDPLDASALLGVLDDPQAAPFDGLPDGTVVGHVHLQVDDVARATAFYQGVLGFDLTARYGADAVFLSAGGYHHHVGANTWASRGAPPPPPGSASLRHATILVEDAAARDAVLARAEAAGHAVEPYGADGLVRDPAGIALVVAARS
jgi:catechol 2,3-dioxygenase